MIVSIIIFLVSIVVLGVLCFRMSIIWPTIIKIAGIILIMFSTIMFCVKMSGYNTTLHNEYSLYLLLFQIKIPKSKTVLMTNIGVSLLMISSALILVMLQKKTFLHGLVYVVTVTVFFYVYYPRTAEKIYLVLLKNGYSQSTILHIKDILDSASLLVIVIYIVVPYLVMLHKYRRTLLYERRKEMLASGIVWFLIDLTLLIMLFGGGLYHYMFFELNFSSYPLKVEKLKSGFIMLLPSIIMVCTILFMVRRYEPMGKWTKEKEHRQLLQAKDEGVFVLLHAYKNAFGSIMMYADCENQEYAFLGSEEKRLEIVKRIAQEQFDKLNNAINIFKTNNQR